MTSRAHLRDLLAVALVITGFAGSGALANPTMDSVQFRQMQEQGFSHKTAIAFAAFAAAQGDVSSAIAALEHSLSQNGPNTEIHARLADLYAGVGNEGLALHHADLAGTTVEPERATFWGRAAIGVAHDSNPTSAESSAQVQVFDAQSNTFLNVAARNAEPDALATVSLDLSADYRLSPEALMATELNIQSETYFDTDDLDTISGSFTVGPWFGPGESSAGDVWLRPYLTFGGALLDGDHYYSSYGIGADLRFALGEDAQAAFGATILRTDFNGRISPDFDTNTLDNTALLLSAGLSGQGPLDSTWSTRISGGATDASRSSESYIHVGFDAGISVPIVPFGEWTGLPLALRLAGSVDRFSYTDFDPNIDPTRQRRDLWYGGKGSLLLTIVDNVDLIVGADYLRRGSNIAAFESDNLRIFSELGVHF